jgi:hypothetical protein
MDSGVALGGAALLVLELTEWHLMDGWILNCMRA